jgi:hypothetical protein
MGFDKNNLMYVQPSFRHSATQSVLVTYFRVQQDLHRKTVRDGMLPCVSLLRWQHLSAALQYTAPLHRVHFLEEQVPYWSGMPDAVPRPVQLLQTLVAAPPVFPLEYMMPVHSGLDLPCSINVGKVRGDDKDFAKMLLQKVI